MHEPGETTFLYCLDRHGACRFEARFTPGTPDAVITASIDAALCLARAPRARDRQAAGQRRTAKEGGEPR